MAALQGISTTDAGIAACLKHGVCFALVALAQRALTGEACDMSHEVPYCVCACVSGVCACGFAACECAGSCVVDWSLGVCGII